MVLWPYKRAALCPAVSFTPLNVTPPTNASRTTKTPAASRSAAQMITRATSIALVNDQQTFTGTIAKLPIVLDQRRTARPTSLLKRGIDIAGALVALVVASPIIALVAVAIKFESSGPIFFAHNRLGRHGRLFSCWKFRSMHADAETRLRADAALRRHYITNHFKIPQHLDPRITRLGHFLRRSSLDELPQLWNVLRGEMSLVGPRPIVPLESNHYGDDLSLLLSVRPGLTGAWAVHGRSSVGYPQRASIELEYVRSCSLATDLDILIRTPSAVFSQRGAN